MNQDLEEAKKKILKASVLWDLYKINFGEEYAEKVTHYTKKMWSKALLSSLFS